MPAGFLKTLLIAIAILAGSGAARAELVTRQEYFRDETGALQLPEIRDQKFLPYKGVLAAGYGRDTIWFRFLIDPKGRDRGKLIVRVRPSNLDIVTVHDHEGGVHRTGDVYPGSVERYRSTNLNAEIDAPAGLAEIFVAVRSKTSRPILIEILPLDEAIRKDAIQLAMIAGYWMLVFFSFLLAGIHLSRSPEPLIGWFALRQVTELIYLSFNRGLARLIFDEAPYGRFSATTDLVNFGYVGITMGFVWALVGEYRPRPISRAIFGGIFALWAAAVVIYASGDLMSGLRANLFTALLLSFLLVPAALLTDQAEPQKNWVLPRSLMIGMCVVLAVLAGAALLVQVGIVGEIVGPELTSNSILLVGIVTTVCFSSFMYARSVRLAADRDASERRSIVAQMNELQERQNREEQEKLLSMLAHELRTPMSVMKMQLGPWLAETNGVVELRRAVEDMSAVLDKALQAGQVGGEALGLQLVGFDLATEVEGVCAKFPEDRLRIEVPETWHITNDLTLIRVALKNLVENAVKYGSEDHPIVVSARPVREDGLLELSVVNMKSDFGFPDPEIVFKKYVRGPNAHRKSGSGLGLFIVDTIATRLGGEAFYERQGDLIRFGLRVPADLGIEPSEVAGAKDR